ncbi:hypothetical protein [Faecalicatena contorta]|uniref:Uncharacterized protein n=1 Tax=Faecalicatena contorta TaxID=39482 RepID=A0A315ZZL9_9FIRM|nr:hypothetical protein [Faecalicatena contorta]PWJ51106.1 hypothetical protein A8805_103407 [Faecalicatena contorta]SUQ13674.1 hypothetical protein SAMN05216529_103407 [Faecalicatena contorta]
MGSNTKFGAKEVMDVILYDMSTNKPVIFFDTLKTSNIEVTSEKVYARGGKGNSKLITWELNKEGKLTIEDALLSPKSLELISGVATVTGAQTVYMRQTTEYDTTGEKPVDKGEMYPLTASASGVIELAYAPKENAASILVYEADDDCGTPLSMTSATLSGKTLTIDDAANKKVIVYYTFASGSTTETYVIDASHFSGTYKLVGNTVIRNRETSKDEAFQVVIPNLKWSSNLSLGFSAEGDPQPTSFECEILKAANSSTMIQMTRWA